ncbi:MAG: phosphopyruvate hydratase [Patescibacteria group bacterium]|nr:phosphopyruvate hydratase [Patescibacteria group bacterium]
MAKIKEIKAREILDSRGNPSVEATVILNDGATYCASCPSGASVGGYEAAELRDQDPDHFNGMGVLKAIDNVHNLISPALAGIDVSKQQEIDRKMIELDGTQNKGKLGANATLSVSMSICRAAAKVSMIPLFLYLRQFIRKEAVPPKIPTPMFNLINGGKHAENNLNFQEFLVIPASSTDYSKALNIGASVYKNLKDALRLNNFSTLIGDEGGYSPKVENNLDALSLLKNAITKSGLRIGFDIFFGLDAASDNFYVDKKYNIKDKQTSMSSKDLISFYEELNKNYHLLYLEDPMQEDDWDSWTDLSAKISQETIVVGDDLTATNPYRLQMALDKKAITGIIIKPNQIGTVIEALAVVEIARAAGLKIIVSHRSGETNDDFIADFAVGASADYVKFGAPARGERVAKYNRLLEIENQLTQYQKI